MMRLAGASAMGLVLAHAVLPGQAGVQQGAVSSTLLQFQQVCFWHVLSCTVGDPIPLEAKLMQHAPVHVVLDVALGHVP